MNEAHLESVPFLSECLVQACALDKQGRGRRGGASRRTPRGHPPRRTRTTHAHRRSGSVRPLCGTPRGETHAVTHMAMLFVRWWWVWW